jgi:hypothetical protein
MIVSLCAWTENSKAMELDEDLQQKGIMNTEMNHRTAPCMIQNYKRKEDIYVSTNISQRSGKSNWQWGEFNALVQFFRTVHTMSGHSGTF